MAQIDAHALKLFVMVAEELHFGRAAQLLGMSQPPLSQQIRRLEQRLGGALFERTKRSVKLTPLGELLLDDARDVLQRIDRIELRAQRWLGGEAGPLRLGYVSTALDDLLAPALAQLRQQHPAVSIELLRLGTSRQLEEVRQGTLDVGIVRIFDHPSTGILSRVLWRENYVLVTSTSDALSGRRRVGLRELGTRPLLMFQRSGQPALYDRIMQTLERCGARPETVTQVETKREIVALARTGLGVGLVPASCAAWTSEGVAFVPVSSDLPPVELSAIYARRPRTALVERFLACLEQCSNLPAASTG